MRTRILDALRKARPTKIPLNIFVSTVSRVSRLPEVGRFTALINAMKTTGRNCGKK
jgi:hypothetical protein